MNGNDRKKYAAEQKEKLNDFSSKIVSLASHFNEKPETIAEYLRFSSQFYQYSCRNTMAIFMQNPHATFVGSFAFFKEKGYSVKKGETGLKILVPTPVTYFRLTKEQEFKRVIEADEKEKAAIKKGCAETIQKMHFKLGTVFDISQTNCPPEDYPKIFDVGVQSVSADEKIEKLKQYCKDKLNCPVDMVDLKSISLHGRYFPTENRIEINSLLESTQALSTLAHEIGHAVLHHSRDAIQNTSASQRELEADCISLLIQSKLGIDDGQNDVRARHLSNHYKIFISESETDEKRPAFEAVMKNVFERFTTVWNDMQPYFARTSEQSEKIKDTVVLSHESSLHSGGEPAGEKNSISFSEKEPFDIQVDKAIAGKLNPRNALFVCDTPPILIDAGVKPLPILYTQKHLKEVVHQYQKFLSGEEQTMNEKCHVISNDKIKKLPDLLKRPAMIMDSFTQKNSIVVVSGTVNEFKQPIVLSLKVINGKGRYNENWIDTNFITSVYGRNEFENFINRAVEKKKLLYVNKEISQQLEVESEVKFLGGIQAIGFDYILHQSNNVVNNHNMQKTEKNSISFSEKEPFDIQVDKAIAGKLNPRNALFVCDTPAILIDAGLEPLPMLYTQSHLKNAVHSKSKTNSHWHGLSVEQIKSLPELTKEPTMIYDSLTRNDSVVMVLSAVDNDRSPILMSIKPNGHGQYQFENINANFITSIYGKEHFQNHIVDVVRQNKLLYINKEKSQALESMSQLQLLRGLPVLDYNIILHQSNNVVNNHNMQKTEKNSISDIKQANNLLQHGVKENNPEKIKEAVKSGADVNAKQQEQEYPLFTAVSFNADKAVRALLENGAYPDVRDDQSNTPLFYAAQLKDSKIKETLISYGADEKLAGLKKDTVQHISLSQSKGRSR